MTIEQLTEDFVTKLEARIKERVRETIVAAFDLPHEYDVALTEGASFRVGPSMPATPWIRIVGQGSGAPGRRSPKATAARKLQGRYLGGLRAFKGAARDRIKKIAARSGVAAAVAAMAKGRK